MTNAAEYRRGIEAGFAAAKQEGLTLPLHGDSGTLRAIRAADGSDGSLIGLLSRWRSENSFAYPSQFQVTDAGTGRWLQTRVIDTPDRILFLIHAPDGEPVGHLGFGFCLNDEGVMEVENVVRGVKDAIPGIMTRAMRTMMEWAVREFAPTAIHLRVFNDNPHAVRFYEQLGFRGVALTPLRRHEEGGGVFYRDPAPHDTSPPDKEFLVMEWDGLVDRPERER